jgi:hypothetical protein
VTHPWQVPCHAATSRQTTTVDGQRKPGAPPTTTQGAPWWADSSALWVTYEAFLSRHCLAPRLLHPLGGPCNLLQTPTMQMVDGGPTARQHCCKMVAPLLEMLAGQCGSRRQAVWYKGSAGRLPGAPIAVKDVCKQPGRLHTALQCKAPSTSHTRCAPDAHSCGRYPPGTPPTTPGHCRPPRLAAATQTTPYSWNCANGLT